jgi:uncharacterized protein (TIGR02147 family)
MAIKPARLLVTDYLDYRTFLKDYFRLQKAAHSAFSMRSFSQSPALKLSSSSFVTSLLQGKKNLSQQLRLKFAKALKLEPREAEYFDFLVQFNQAKSMEEKNYFFSQLSKYRGSRAKLLLGNQYRFFSNWYFTVIWNYFGLEKAEKHPAQIAKHVYPNLTQSQVEEAIALLLEMGLIRKLANGYAVTDRHLATDKEFLGMVAKPYNMEFLRLAEEALDRFPPEDRQFKVLAFSVSNKGYSAIRQRVHSFLDEIREIIERDEGMNQVGILNIQMFPGAKLP